MISSSPPGSTGPASRTAYHHGNLREVLVEAAIELIALEGVEKLSVREAAKRAGVSPGAPFRHFATKTALLTAVAEQSTQRLRAQIETALADSADAPPLVRFGAIGHAYLAWARDNAPHFRVISERRLIDYDGSERIRADNEAIRQHMATLFAEAFGTKSGFDAAYAQIAARALVYGLARMAIDGHFPEWNLSSGPTTKVMDGTLDFFIQLLIGAHAAASAPPGERGK